MSNYSTYFKQAERLLKKSDSPEWLRRYCEDKLSKSKHYRQTSKSVSAKEIGAVGQFYQKAVYTVFDVLDILSVYRLGVKA